MKKSKFSEAQICIILKQHSDGQRAADVCREHGISEATLYKWRSKYGGMEPAMIKEMKDLRAENDRLKRMYAESQMAQALIKEALAKKW